MATLTFKYMIFDYVFPLVFPELFDHRQAVGGFGTPTSAGFVSVRTEKGETEVRVFGRSQGLDLHSEPDDAEIIRLAYFERRAHAGVGAFAEHDKKDTAFEDDLRLLFMEEKGDVCHQE